jgi:phosphoribosyl-ATP pyrophosphohydrolase
MENTDTLRRLVETIRERRVASANASYTRKLLDAGTARCAKKFGEEAVELIVAALQPDDGAVKNEAADVLYHMLVLLEARGVPFEDALAVLDSRMGVSGLAEKAARPPETT